MLSLQFISGLQSPFLFIFDLLQFLGGLGKFTLQFLEHFVEVREGDVLTVAVDLAGDEAFEVRGVDQVEEVLG